LLEYLTGSFPCHGGGCDPFQKNMDKNNLIIIVAMAAIIAGIFYFLNSENQPQSASNSQEAKQSISSDVNNTSSALPQVDSDYQKIMNATIKTSLGDIKIELNGQDMPITAGNFAKLAEAGFYDGVKFHRVISGFMIQTGDPLTKDDTQKQLWGTGGPGYKFNDEPFEGEYNRGAIAMANSGANTNGSQFFIMHQDYPLLPDYVIFGKVLEGMETVDKIAALETDANDRPLDPPVIESITIEH
jgi:cyclophilin family peptidyl-prolyl cis-trans isomerase